MDIENDILGKEPNPDYIKTLLTNIYLSRNAFPLNDREKLLEILGGSGAMALIYDDAQKVDDIADELLARFEKIQDPDQILNAVVGGNYVNIYTKFLLWFDILKIKYPINSKVELVRSLKHLKALGASIQGLVKNTSLPISSPEDLFLKIIYFNPELVDSTQYKKIANELAVPQEDVAAVPAVDVDAQEEGHDGETVEPQESPIRTAAVREGGAGAGRFVMPSIRKRTIDLFVPPKKNRFLITALKTVARMPSGAYNPFFVFGPKGSGKTHIIYALKNEINKLHPDMVTLLLRGDEINHTDTLSLSRTDVILIDDIGDAVAADPEGISQILQGLVDDDKQVIASIDKHPESIPQIKNILDKYEGHLVEETSTLENDELRALIEAWVTHINREFGDMNFNLEIVPTDEALDEICSMSNTPEEAVECLYRTVYYLISQNDGDLSVEAVKRAVDVSISRESDDLPEEAETESTVMNKQPIVNEVHQAAAGEDIKSEVKKEEVSETQWSADEDNGKYELITGLSYIVETETLSKVYSIFRELMENAVPAMTISRSNPRILQHKYGLRKDSILWLTEKQSTEYRTVPSVLENILYQVDEFLNAYDDDERGLLVLDGLEYLISTNNFNTVLKFIRRLVDTVAETNFILLMPLSPMTISTQEMKIIEREMEKLDGIQDYRVSGNKIYIISEG